MYKWVMAEKLGYTPKTTFWNDFEIANMFGISAIKDTFKRAMEEWKTNCEYLTELVLVLNHQSWLQYELGKQKMCELYVELYEKASDYAYENLKGEELKYFYSTTD